MSAAIARVFVNNVEVGSLPIETYRNVVSQVKRSHLIYLRQAWNCVEVLVRLVFNFVKTVPSLALLMLVWLAFFEPQAFDEMATLSPREWAAWVRGSCNVFFIAYLFILGSQFLLTSRVLGFINIIDAEINSRLRTLLEVPAEGEMRVVEIADDGQHG